MAPLVKADNVGPLVLRRAVAPVQNDHGGYDDQTETVLSLTPVSAHLMSGRELEMLPEADRNRAIMRFYALERLFASDGGQAADRIEYQGRTYRVTQAEDFSLQGGVWMALAELEEVTS